MRVRTIVAVLMLLLTARAVCAQSTGGNIIGIVQDPSMLAAAGATLTLTNLDEIRGQSTVSDSSGAFQLINLEPGRYMLVASLAG